MAHGAPRGRDGRRLPTLLTTEGDDALVLMLSDDGVLQSRLSVDGAEFEAGEALDSGVPWVQLGGAVRLPDGSWFALGSGGQEVVDGTIVAVGDYRTARDTSMGGFQAQAWTSLDGETFTEADLPGVLVYRGYDDESYAGDLVESDGRLLSSGRVGRRAAMWVSDDAGRTWSAIADPVLGEAYDVPALERAHLARRHTAVRGRGTGGAGDGRAGDAR